MSLIYPFFGQRPDITEHTSKDNGKQYHPLVSPNHLPVFENPGIISFLVEG